MRDAVDVLEFDQLVGEQAQAPALLALGRRTAGQRDEVRFLRAIEAALALEGGRLAAERGLEALLNQALAHTPNGWQADIQRVGDRIVRPGWASGALVSLE